jgi:hypothetical protein
MHPALNIKRTVRDKNLRVGFSSITAWQEGVGPQFTVRRLHMFAVRGRFRECRICGGGGAGGSVELGVCGSAGGVRQGGVDENLILRMTADGTEMQFTCWSAGIKTGVFRCNQGSIESISFRFLQNKNLFTEFSAFSSLSDIS